MDIETIMAIYFSGAVTMALCLILIVRIIKQVRISSASQVASLCWLVFLWPVFIVPMLIIWADELAS